MGEADLDNALAWDYIKPARFFVEMTLKKPFIETLQEQSKQRRLQLEEFGFLKQRIGWYEEREEQKTISLNLEKRKLIMEEDKEFIDQMKEKQRQLAEINFDSTEVKLDTVLKEEAENEEEEEPDLASTEVTPLEEDGELAQTKATPSEDSDIEVSENEEDEEPVPDFDIQLRETLRIMVDAVNASPNINDWKQPALPLASSKSRFEKLIN